VDQAQLLRWAGTEHTYYGDLMATRIFFVHKISQEGMKGKKEKLPTT
jgi:hypothetical protein